MSPTTKIAVAPRTRPSGSEEPWNSGRSWGSEGGDRERDQQGYEHGHPAGLGRDPLVHLRSSGWATYPIRVATRRTGKVAGTSASMATASDHAVPVERVRRRSPGSRSRFDYGLARVG